ncbi:MAG: nucleotidyltransferase domain-containing protein [Nitrospirae bacterium]|nr:nucleotidyltransferase domain-containing protein [Nitrospirota bacterium]
MLIERFKKLQAKVLSGCRAYYGDRLVSLVVYGSAGRETMRFDSDVDILIIARNLPKGRMKRVAEFSKIEDALIQYMEQLKKKGIYTDISPIFKTPEEAQRGSPLFLDMVDDAKILYDKDGFFAAVLERLRNRLKELGSKRIWKGNAWYWDLKPDYKPGEVFEI